MIQKAETPGAGRRTRASKLVCSAADNSEDNAAPFHLQAIRLVRRHGVSWHVARAILELTVEAGRARR
jgi:hypothetical protein